MTARTSDYSRGLLLTAIGGMALTFDIPLIRLGGGEAWSVLMVRSATTFVAALAIWAVWRAITPNAPALVPGWAGLACATLYGLGSITFIASVYSTSTANVVFILAFTTAFTTLLSWAFLREWPRRPTLLAMAAMIAGVLIIVGDSIGTGNLFGDLMALCTSFSIASAITVSRASGRDMGFTPLVGVLMPLLLAGWMVGQTGYRIDVPGWIVFSGLVMTPLSFFCLAAGPRYIPAPEVAMFYLLETVLAPVWVWMIFSEMPSRNSLIGGAILVAALIAHSLWQLADSRRRAAAVSGA